VPYDDPEPDDPNMLVGVALPGRPETTREMVEAFADEFAALGLTRDEILALFRTPEYAAPHGAWKSLGDAEVNRIVDESLGFWGQLRVTVTDRVVAEEDESGSGLVRAGGFLKVLR
jgi:hypothetical protein